MRWLRRRILVVVARSAAVLYGVAVASILGGLKLFTGSALVVSVPWALVAGQALVGLWLGWAALTNPLALPYLRARAGAPRRLAVAAATDPALRSLDALTAPELLPLATVWDTTDTPYPSFDLFQTPRRSVTAVRNRLSGAVTLLSRLDDGRILLTDTIATAPHRRLVVNLAPEDDLRVLLARHLEAIAVLRHVASVVADDAGLFVEAQAIEQVAFTTLGPVLGPFYNPAPAPAPARFLVTVSPADLLALALDRARTPVRPRPPSAAAGASPVRSPVRPGALATG